MAVSFALDCFVILYRRNQSSAKYALLKINVKIL